MKEITDLFYCAVWGVGDGGSIDALRAALIDAGVGSAATNDPRLAVMGVGGVLII